MALPKDQEDIVLAIAANCDNDSDRDALVRILSANDAIRGGFLRQADYDRAQNRLKAEVETERSKYKSLYDQNVDWREKHATELGELRTAKSAWETEREALEKRVQEAAANAGGEGDVKQEDVQKLVDEKIKGMGLDPNNLSAAAITKIVNDSVTEVAKRAESDFINNTLPLQTAFAMDMAEIAHSHITEFGSKIDRAKFSEFCKERNFTDPSKAYEEFVKPQRETSERKKWEETERERIAKEEREKASAAAIPGGGAVPGMNPGLVQDMVAKATATANGANSPGGWQAAAQEARSSGKV